MKINIKLCIPCGKPFVILVVKEKQYFHFNNINSK